MRKITTEFEYRKISEERCKEIDSWEIHDPYGYGWVFTAEKEDFVTNMEESILFCHAFGPRHDDREWENETYLFIMNKEYHIVNYIMQHAELIGENSWIIYVKILEKDFINNCGDRVLNILKEVLSVFIKKSRREIPGEQVEYHIYYRGKEV